WQRTSERSTRPIIGMWTTTLGPMVVPSFTSPRCAGASRPSIYYNKEHRHSGIGLHPPADVHFGMAEVVREKRPDVLDAAYAAMPSRFRRPPQAPRIPEVFWINRPEEAPIAI